MRIDYKNMKLLSEEQKSEQELQFAVEEAKQQLQADTWATKRSLADAKKRLEIAKTTFPLEATTIVNISNEVEGYELGLKKLEALAKEFGFVQ